ncbi:hypothetical protein LPW11_21605 [Geomonas sp. RF6]|uniref:hypothetical protein n=1 Tax=Geomonas sp. RF6 TaxID=2897342 RepID=UPI001E62DD6E|nr:hypothetical protein [Geomonas sp. RF6]UFS70452.1 hypothetical protein LPW11_21605 [Geomonas sp. RF6]
MQPIAARILANEDVVRVRAEIPEGHLHLRTTIELADGTSLTFQEATIAAIARAYLAVKADPLRTRIELTGQKVARRKRGYAEWQLLEEP